MGKRAPIGAAARIGKREVELAARRQLIEESFDAPIKIGPGDRIFAKHRSQVAPVLLTARTISGWERVEVDHDVCTADIGLLQPAKRLALDLQPLTGERPAKIRRKLPFRRNPSGHDKERNSAFECPALQQFARDRALDRTGLADKQYSWLPGGRSRRRPGQKSGQSANRAPAVELDHADGIACGQCR